MPEGIDKNSLRCGCPFESGQKLAKFFVSFNQKSRVIHLRRERVNSKSTKVRKEQTHGSPHSKIKMNERRTSHEFIAGSPKPHASASVAEINHATPTWVTDRCSYPTLKRALFMTKYFTPTGYLKSCRKTEILVASIVLVFYHAFKSHSGAPIRKRAPHPLPMSVFLRLRKAAQRQRINTQLIHSTLKRKQRVHQSEPPFGSLSVKILRMIKDPLASWCIRKSSRMVKSLL